MGYVLHHGGGWTDDVDILDAVDLRNAQSTDEVHTKRVNSNEITVQKDANADFIFPVISEGSQQPHDGKKVTKRTIGNDDVVISDDKREDNTSQAKVGRSSDSSEDKYPQKVLRAKTPKKKKMPPAASSEEGAPSVEGGELSDADTVASEETKYLPEFWWITRDVLIRFHNKPRRTLCTPNEDPDDPSPIPLRFIDIMRRTTTSCASKAEAIIEDFRVGYADEHRELSDEWVGQTMFYLRRPAAKKGYEWQSCRETKVQAASTRPNNVWVEVWKRWSRAACRDSHGLVEQIPKEQAQECNVIMVELLEISRREAACDAMYPNQR